MGLYERHHSSYTRRETLQAAAITLSAHVGDVSLPWLLPNSPGTHPRTFLWCSKTTDTISFIGHENSSFSFEMYGCRILPRREPVERGAVVDGGPSRSTLWRAQRRPVEQRRDFNSSEEGSATTSGRRRRCGAVDLMIELLSCYLLLPPPAPLVAFGCGNGRWSVRARAQAVKALRHVVPVTGVLQAEEYALHSLRIRGATHLSVGRADPGVLKSEGRGASGAYEAFMRSHGRNVQWVSGAITERGMRWKRQAEQGTMRGNCSP